MSRRTNHWRSVLTQANGNVDKILPVVRHIANPKRDKQGHFLPKFRTIAPRLSTIAKLETIAKQVKGVVIRNV